MLLAIHHFYIFEDPVKVILKSNNACANDTNILIIKFKIKNKDENNLIVYLMLDVFRKKK